MGTNTLILVKCEKASYFVGLSPLAQAWCDERRMTLADVASDCHRFHAHGESSETLGRLLTQGAKLDARERDAVREYMAGVQGSKPRVTKKR